MIHWNQLHWQMELRQKTSYPGSVPYRMGYVITYANCMILWEIQIQAEILLSTTEAEYIKIYQAMRDVLPFVILMKEIYFVLELQHETLKVLRSL